MKESVSAILIHENDFFIIQRQNYLKAFPGYYSFPGGKVDKEDHDFAVELGCEDIENYLLVALRRELQEELGIDLLELKNEGLIVDIVKFASAVTPDFNPHRFKNHYFKVILKQRLDLKAEEGEAQKSLWINSHSALEQYNHSEMLVVPPMITILNDLDRDIHSKVEIDPNLKYDSETEVPLIIPVAGVRQFLPLSNTFPPANRTNSFLLGDSGQKMVLVDPSPKCNEELNKFYNSLSRYNIDLIFLTHHHPDHHQFATDMAMKFQCPLMMSADTQARIMEKYGVDYFADVELQLAKEGDILTISGGHEIDIISTPGHDEGQLTLIRKDKAWAIVSDLIQTIGTVVIGGDEGDMNKYFRSLERVINIDPLNIFPSHGIGMGGTHKLKETLKHRLIREKQVNELKERGLGLREMLAEIYPELPERLHKYALLTIEAHLQKIEQVGLN
jgi:glyoxylase-like metal-dependent hydrolase (beta-lactamase superfamily II)/8-oxo-dGTP pyrophosphatase MutT (NUDIX family)